MQGRIKALLQRHSKGIKKLLTLGAIATAVIAVKQVHLSDNYSIFEELAVHEETTAEAQHEDRNLLQNLQRQRRRRLLPTAHTQTLQYVVSVPETTVNDSDTLRDLYEKYTTLTRSTLPPQPLTESHQSSTVVSPESLDDMNIDQLLAFLRVEQKEHRFDTAKCIDLINKISNNNNSSSSNVSGKTIGWNEFVTYLFSSENQLFDVDMIFNQSHSNANESDGFETIDRIMSQPLSHYFVSSSHNTYLMKDQLFGSSSTGAYKNVLLKGARCIEVDVWDGADGEPVVYHGWTLTSKIKFRHVLDTIKKHAFTVSPYPLIISLEVHCSLPQQIKMSQYLQSTFRDSLAPTDVFQQSQQQQLPSPASLKYKVLLQGEVAYSDSRNKTTTAANESEDDEFQRRLKYYANDNNVVTDVLQLEFDKLSADDLLQPQKQDFRIDTKYGYVTKEGQWAKELYDMIHFRSVPFRNPELSDGTVPPLREIFNMSESYSARIFRKYLSQARAYHENRLTRIYPRGGRFFSSNYNPSSFWKNGCQLVSLNFQRRDAVMRMHTGFFMQDASFGYVLQPKYRTSQYTRPADHWLYHCNQSYLHHPQSQQFESVASPATTEQPRKLPYLIRVNVISAMTNVGPREKSVLTDWMASVAKSISGSPRDDDNQSDMLCALEAMDFNDVHIRRALTPATLTSSNNVNHQESSSTTVAADEHYSFPYTYSVPKVFEFYTTDINTAVVTLALFQKPRLSLLSPPVCVAYAAVPTNAMKLGYRNVVLRDEITGDVRGVLLLHVEAIPREEP